jgi:TfoX/Sxy family transcriptional regulator of competence genes
MPVKPGCKKNVTQNLRKMSKSIHITKKNFKGLTKAELDEQAQDPNSELTEWARKSAIKKEIKKNRKNEKNS